MRRFLHCRAAVLLACLLTAGLLCSVRAVADEPKPAPLDSKALDKQLYEVLRKVHNDGADIYNRSDWAGCYRMFQGALMTVRPLLDHNKDAQKAIDNGMAKAAAEVEMHRRAFVLHETIEEVRDKINPDPKKAEVKLWDRLGGEGGVTRVVDEFAARAAADPKVDFTRGGKYKPTPAQMAELKKELVQWVSSHTGGPLKYTGKSMKESHKGMNITDAQFDAAVADLKFVLERNKVKQEDIDALLKIVESTRKDVVEEKHPEDLPGGTKPPAAGASSVTGKITFKGKPLADGMVLLWGEGAKEAISAKIVDGSYSIKGVKPGKYTVCIDKTGAAVPKMYSDPKTSPITLRVQEGDNEMPPLELKDK